ncbi:MAG: ISAs1 family transposase, partial [Pseudomonadota bacterium]
LESCIDYDKGHGRIETRECIVSDNIDWLREAHPLWHTINSIIRINSTRDVLNGKTTKETRYYISSLKKTKPEKFLKSIREHWAIENSLHWVLDMSFNEDYSRIRKENAPHVMAIMRHIALNMLQRNKPKNQSVKGYRKICSWDDEALAQLIMKNK